MSTDADRPAAAHRPLKAGEAVIFVDNRGRTFQKFLKAGGKTDLRGHQFPHDEIIGREEGFVMRSSRGQAFHILRPTIGEYVTDMPRYATVIYPKDLATILVWADVYPGLKVIEAGIGSGGLAATVLRAIGETGTLVSYEIREEAYNRARKNIEALLGETPNHVVHQTDIYEGIEETDVDRILLDVPEPWHVVPHAATALRDGGVFMAYSPTVLQVRETALALQRSRYFTRVETMETLLRPWYVAANSVRPELRMVAHSGFLTFARKVRPEEGAAVEAPAPEAVEAVEAEGALPEGAPPADEGAPAENEGAFGERDLGSDA